MGRGQNRTSLTAMLRPSPATSSAATVPPLALARLEEMLASLNGQELLLGDSDIVEGYWLETHTIGCRNAADTDPGRWWEEHWEIFSEYQSDPQTLVLGDPADGIFATLSRLKAP